MTAPANLARKNLEWRVLRLLCANPQSSAAHLKMGDSLLHPEDFADPLHRTLFEQILLGAECKMTKEEFRRWLPAAMTRKGWPDLDFDDLFRAEELDSPRAAFLDAARMLRTLSESGLSRQ